MSIPLLFCHGVHLTSGASEVGLSGSTKVGQRAAIVSDSVRSKSMTLGEGLLGTDPEVFGWLQSSKPCCL